MDVRASLHVSQLISQIPKLTTIKISNNLEACKTQKYQRLIWVMKELRRENAFYGYKNCYIKKAFHIYAHYFYNFEILNLTHF
jgi:hypothetical protein